MKATKKVLASLFVTAGMMGSLTAQAESAPAFKDLNQASSWSRDAITQAQLLNLLTGDADGNFRLTVQPGATLVFSSIGFKKQEIIVSGRTTLDVKMEEESAALNEVVVVGYGTQSRATITGAIGKVEAQDLVRTPASAATCLMVIARCRSISARRGNARR
mgnify:CR=1 FL=1